MKCFSEACQWRLSYLQKEEKYDKPILMQERFNSSLQDINNEKHLQ